MILKASQRGGALALARHLQRTDENDHVEVHELRGFASETLSGALNEVAAISKGTRCLQYMFSVSLNPPESETVPVKVFEEAVKKIEEQLGLQGQPRAVVFHEKEGRRHAHAVWSRIDAQEMKAINLSHFKRKLQAISKQLYLEHGWALPEGLQEKGKGNPLNFSREEWQQAKRIKLDPRTIKTQFQEAWATSDDHQSFAAALEGRGYFLAKGDRRGFVAVDVFGEVYSLSKWTGQKSKALKDRLGDPEDLPSVDNLKTTLREKVTHKVQTFMDEVQRQSEKRTATLALKKTQLRERQRSERTAQQRAQQERQNDEAKTRAGRFRRGLRGVWDWLSGKSKETKRQNEREAKLAMQRDRDERDALIQKQLQQRRSIQGEIIEAQCARDEQIAALRGNLATVLSGNRQEPSQSHDLSFDKAEISTPSAVNTTKNPQNEQEYEP
ncbi:MAG: relaxase [Pseudomonadota bacterium]